MALRLFQGHDVRVGDVHTPGVALANDSEYLFGIRHPLQQGCKGWRVHVVTHVKDHETALDRPVMAPGLLLQDLEPESPIVQPGPTEDRACQRSLLMNRSRACSIDDHRQQ